MEDKGAFMKSMQFALKRFLVLWDIHIFVDKLRFAESFSLQ